MNPEEKIILKRNQIIQNQLAYFYEDDFLSEAIFKPVGNLNENSIFTRRIDKNKYFYVIIDAMDKDINALLTSLNTVSFLKYFTQQTIKKNQFNLKEVIDHFIEYVKSILLPQEILRTNIIYIEDKNLHIANFGMPPIYTETGKITANNLPISINTSTIQIDTIPLPKKILMFSDGILEAPLKKEEGVYFSKFKKIKDNITFLKDLLTDFKANAIQENDVTAVLIQKDEFKAKKIFSLEKTLHSSDDINEVLDQLYALDKEKDRMLFIFQEILMNTYEHNMVQLSKDKEILIAQDKLHEEKVKRPVKIKIDIFENDEFIKIIFFEENKTLNVNIENLRFKKYHGKGLRIVLNISDAVFMSEDMQYTKIFLKKS